MANRSPVQPRNKTISVDLAAARKQLNLAFSDSGLVALCLDHFPAVYDQLGRGMGKDEKITVLLEYCRKPTRYQKLLFLLEEYRE